MLVPASVLCAVLAEPIVRVVYQRGDFTAARRPRLPPRSPRSRSGSPFNGFMLMLNRAFFSLQSPWIPTWVALGNLGLNAALDGAFYSLGIWGLPLATSIVNIAGTAALLVLLRRRLGRLDLTDTRHSFGLDHSWRAPRSPASPTASGPGSTPRSAGRSSPRSSRCSRRSPPASVPTSSAAGCSACASSTRCSRCGAGARLKCHRVHPLDGGRPPLVEEWLRREHVARWWRDDIAESLAEYRAALEGREPTDHYLIVVDGRPVGMIQTYLVSDYPEWEEVVQVGDGRRRRRPPDRRGRADRPGARAADPGRVRARRDRRAARVVATVEEPNRRSWRAFEKAGFRHVRDVEEDGVPHRLMRLDR